MNDAPKSQSKLWNSCERWLKSITTKIRISDNLAISILTTIVSVPILMSGVSFLFSLATFQYCQQHGIRFPFEGLPPMPSLIYYGSLIAWVAFTVMIRLLSSAMVDMGSQFKTIVDLLNRYDVLGRKRRQYSPMPGVTINEPSHNARVHCLVSLIFLCAFALALLLKYCTNVSVHWSIPALLLLIPIAHHSILNESPDLIGKFMRALLCSACFGITFFSLGLSFWREAWIATFLLIGGVDLIASYPKITLPLASAISIFYVWLCSFYLLGEEQQFPQALSDLKYGGGIPIVARFEESGGAASATEIEGQLLLRSNHFCFVQGLDGKVIELPIQHIRELRYPPPKTQTQSDN